MELLIILYYEQLNFDLTQKTYPIDKILCHHQKFYLLENTFKK